MGGSSGGSGGGSRAPLLPSPAAGYCYDRGAEATQPRRRGDGRSSAAAAPHCLATTLGLKGRGASSSSDCDTSSMDSATRRASSPLLRLPSRRSGGGTGARLEPCMSAMGFQSVERASSAALCWAAPAEADGAGAASCPANPLLTRCAQAPAGMTCEDVEPASLRGSAQTQTSQLTPASERRSSSFSGAALAADRALAPPALHCTSVAHQLHTLNNLAYRMQGVCGGCSCRLPQ